MLIGDGMSDLAARPAIDLIVGFGGVIARQNVASRADIFIKCKTLAPVLPLALSKDERARLQHTEHQTLLDKGITLIEAGEVDFRAFQ